MPDLFRLNLLLAGSLAHLALAQQTTSTASASHAAAPAIQSRDAEQVLEFEKNMEAAVVRGDVALLDRLCLSDFSITHGDGWVSGGQPIRTENKAQWLASMGKQPFLARDLHSVQVELHGEIAITYGMLHGRYRTAADPSRREFTIWFERVYARKNGQWQFLSHRTVHGPVYGPE